MKRTEKQSDAEIALRIDDLLSDPPVNEAEIAYRIQDIAREPLRKQIIARIELGPLCESDENVFAIVLEQIGLGRQTQRIVALAMDSERPTELRHLALRIMTACCTPETVMEVMDSFDPEDFERLGQMSLETMLVRGDPEERSEIIKEMLLTLEFREAQDNAIDQTEACRQDNRISAASAYSSALATAELRHLHPRLIEILVREGSPDSVPVLTQLRDQAETAAARRAFQNALLRIQTQRIDPNHEPPPVSGYAAMGSCDGQGAFILIVCIETPNGLRDIGDLCIRAAADIRDGFWLRRQTVDDEQQFMEEIRQMAHAEFVRIDLGAAVGLCVDGLARTNGMQVSLPSDIDAVVQEFLRLKDLCPPAPWPTVEPAATATVQDYLDLFDLPYYRDGWFFDNGDLAGVGAKPPPKKSAGAQQRWIVSTIKRLDIPAIHERLRAMTQHMARWHAAAGQLERAALCAAGHLSLQQDFPNSPLVQAMVEHSIRVLVSPRPPGPLATGFGNPKLRKHFRELFFSDVRKPQFKNLALLDMTEATHNALEILFNEMRGEYRPRIHDMEQAAHQIARLFVAALWKSNRPDPFGIQADIVNALAETCRLSQSQAVSVGMPLMFSLLKYLEEICNNCPSGCFVHRKGEADPAHFFGNHPLLDENPFEKSW